LREIRIPLIGSTITPIVVFLPLISIAGVTGIFFRALAITIGIALLISLALAMSWTPTLSHYFIRHKKAPAGDSPGQVDPEEARGLFKGIIQLYLRSLGWALVHPILLLGGSLLLIIVSFFGYQLVGSDLLPGMDEGGFIIDYWMPAGSSLAETDRVIASVDRRLHEIPEVESTSRRTGLQLGLAAVTEANTGDISVKLKRQRHRSSEEVVAEAREKIAAQEPMLQVEFVQLLQDMIGDLSNAPEPIAIRLFSQDPDTLRQWAPQVADSLKKIPGVVDVLDGIDNTISGPAIVFKVNPVAAARSGFTPEEVQLNASALLQGAPASTPVVANDRVYTIRVRFPDSSRGSLEQMRQTVFTSSTGKTATLGSLALLEVLPGQTEILRENLQRNVTVTARLEGLNLGSGMAAVQKTLRQLHLPSSIRLAFGGAYEEQQRSFHDLMVVLILAVLLVFLVLLVEFGDFGAPTSILFSALLSSSGVFLALLISRTTFNISSFMGLIMVIGIVAKNGILLLDAYQKYRSAGQDGHAAMVLAGERRLRPILMTALATMAGMLPLTFAWGAGSQMLQPLAIAVIGGILASMVLSLILTPAVYFLIERHAKVGLVQRKTG
jgi:multidrug efflux pump subunit AcrB